MRKIIISFCILITAFSLKAQSISGIRIDGGNTPVLVYLDGRQLCYPTTTCFIANLAPGNYAIEVFASRLTRLGERVWKGERLYNDRVFFKGNGVMDIVLQDSNDDIRHGRPDGYGDAQGRWRRDYYRHNGVMNDQVFRLFFEQVKSEPFESDRIELIANSLRNSNFTSEQCLQLVKFYTFDSERLKIMEMIYPNIVDKEAFFMVTSTLTFSSSRTKMNDFIKQYEEH